MQLALVYDPRYHSFESWSSLMCEAYATQQLQSNATEDEWKEFAAGMMGIDVFQNEAIPSPYLYEDWRDWAHMLVNAVSPRT